MAGKESWWETTFPGNQLWEVSKLTYKKRGDGDYG
jgi:hypothetical protein